MADIYSDFLYMNSKTSDLINFAKEVAAKRCWTKEACYVIGNMFSSLNQHENSIKWLKRALIIDPNYEAALIVSGNEYIELKSPKDAITAYSAASSNLLGGGGLKYIFSFFFCLELNPLNYRSFFSLGSVYYLLDDLDQAIYFLKAAINIE